MLNPKAHGPAPAPRRSSQPEPALAAELRSYAPRAPPAGRTLEASRLKAARDAPPEGAPGLGARRRALIVIPTLNEERVVRRVVEQMLDDDELEDPLVVIADGGSVDQTREIVREIARGDARVRLMSNPGRVQSAGLNLAAATATAEADPAWLVRVDAHAEYPRNYASTLIAEAERTGAAAVAVSMETVGEGPFQRAVAAAQNSLLGAGGAPHRRVSRAQWVDHGHHALIDLAAFEAAGGYDESFSHNEDAEFDVRLAKLGGRIWLTDKVRIRYFPRATAPALWKQYFSYGNGRARTVLKHFVPLKYRQALPLAVAPAVAGALLAPLNPMLLLPVLAWMFMSLAFGAALAVRMRDPAVLLSGPAAMIMHLAWSAGFWAQLLTYAGQRLAGDIPAPSKQAAS